MPGGSRVALAALWLLGAAAACGPAETHWQPQQRLVDEVPAATEVPGPPRATIRDDTRTVLRSHPKQRVYQDLGLRLPADGEVSLAMPLPAALAGAGRLVLEPRIKRAGVRERYRGLPPVEVPVQRVAGARPQVPLELRLGRAGAGHPERRAEFFVDARVPPDGPAERIETAELDIPPAAVLEFSIGILEAAWGQGAVDFRLLSCAGEDCTLLFEESLDPAGEGGGAWRDRRVPLAAAAGPGRRLRFETEHAARGPRGYTFPEWGNPTLYVPGPVSGPNLILISLDTLRADHLDSYGYARETAPTLAALTREGTLFESVESAATTTGPSHMTLFTSLQPSVHRVRGNAGFNALPRAAVTLAEALRGAGFSTAAVTEGGGIALQRGFERGFDLYVENPTPLPPEPGTQSAVTFARGLEWLHRVADRRFFLFLHTYEVHGPYLPPPEYARFFRDVPPGLEPHPDLNAKRQPVLYDREIRYVDDQLHGLLAGIEALGLRDDTLLVITSDHGEEFFDHGLYGHGAQPFQEVLRVPLFFRGPGVARGRRVQAPVGLVDLMPTLLELTGVPVPPGLMGQSFAALVRGEAPDGHWAERPIFSEAWFGRGITAKGRKKVDQPTFSVRLGARKLVRYRAGEGFRYEYYDLAEDPGEQHDLYPERAEEAADLRALLDSYESGTDRLHAALSRGESPTQYELDPDRAEALRALGYLD